MQRRYQIYIPEAKNSFQAEWAEIRTQIAGAVGNGYLFVKLNIFISVTNVDEYKRYKSLIELDLQSIFNHHLPALSITSHAPEEGFSVAVEAAHYSSGEYKVTYHSYNETPYVLVQSKYGNELWAGGLGISEPKIDTADAARHAFEKVVLILTKEGFEMDHIVRQWNYVGDILKIENGFQNYQVFNEIRNEYYHQYRHLPGYPAATGIGMKLDGVLIDFCAVKPSDKVQIQAVDNPKQVNPYAYNQQVLKGQIFEGKVKKQAPQFERAKLIANCLYSSLFISGTASIIGQETIGKGDIEQQTRTTIENIKILSDKAHIRALNRQSENLPVEYSVVRVYIKNLADFPVVKEICAQFYGDVPILYIEADICRDDLLVEIEAEMISA